MKDPVDSHYWKLDEYSVGWVIAVPNNQAVLKVAIMTFRGQSQYPYSHRCIVFLTLEMINVAHSSKESFSDCLLWNGLVNNPP